MTQLSSAIGETPTPPRRDGRFVRGALFVLSVATVVILWPFLPWLALAAWFAHLASPAHARVSRALHGRKGGAALLTLALLIVVVVPIGAVLVSLAIDSVSLAEQLMASASGREALSSLVSGSGHHTDLRHIDFNTIAALARQYGGGTLAIGWTVTNSVLEAGLGLFVFFTAAYVFLVDGPRTIAWVERNAPLSIPNVTRLRNAFNEVGRGMIIGIGLCGLVQSIVTTIAFAALGVPRALVLGLLTFFASFLPTFGTTLVWGPVAIGLFLTGRTTEAIILTLIGVFVVSALDNILRPVLARWGKLELHSFVVLIAMLGGLAVMGGWGLLIGPIIVRLAIETLRIARDERAREPACPPLREQEPRGERAPMLRRPRPV